MLAGRVDGDDDDDEDDEQLVVVFVVVVKAEGVQVDDDELPSCIVGDEEADEAGEWLAEVSAVEQVEDDDDDDDEEEEEEDEEEDKDNDEDDDDSGEEDSEAELTKVTIEGENWE